MSREQIEEIAKITCSMYCRDKEKKCAGVQECDMKCLHYQRCEALYKAGYRKQEWISVEERLPDIEGKYLTYTTRKTIEISNFYTYWLGTKPQFDYWITHWMPLPEPPKMKGGVG